MGLTERAALCDRLVFQRDSQRADLMETTPGLGAQTTLISCCLYLVAKGHKIEVTAVKSDHSNDSNLGYHCHYNGFCMDCWPLNSMTPGDYVDPGTHAFRQFLVDLTTAPFILQVGLAGTAFTQVNMERLGAYGFPDSGADHIHIGTSYSNPN